MSPARKLALRLKCPRQVQHRVRGCSWWSQPSAQGQAQWVSQQMEILCAVNRCSTAFHLTPSSPEHSLLPLSLSYKKAVFVVRPSANSPGHCRLSAPEHPHSLLGEWVSHAETGLCAKEVLGGRSVAAVHSRHTTVFLPGCPESRDRCPQ